MTRKKQPEANADAGILPGGQPEVEAALRELKEQYLADRAEIQTRIMRGGLLLRNAYARAMGDIFSVYRSQILTLEDSAAHTVTARLGIKNAEGIIAVRKVISDAAYGMTGDLKKGMEAFIKNLKTADGA